MAPLSSTPVGAATPSLWLPVLLVVGLLAAVGLAFGLSELRLAHRILRSGTDSVLETPNGGSVELRGRVEPTGRPLEAPFTGTPCIAYEYAVEEERSSKNGSSWTTVSSGAAYVPFRLDDGSGSVLVEPPGGDFRLERDARIRVDGGTEPPARIRSYIDRNGDLDSANTSLDLGPLSLRTGSNRRFVERRLDVGDEAHVLGHARYDTGAATGAGQVNAAVGVPEAALASSPSRRLRHRLFGSPFVISDRSERRLGLYAFGLGLVVVLAAIGALAGASLLVGLGV